MTRTVLAISNHSEFIGGGEHSFIDLVCGLPRQWQPLAVVPTAGALLDRLKDSSIPVEAVPLPALRVWHAQAMRAAVKRLRELCRRHDVRLIYGNGSRAAFYGGLAGRLIGIPAVWHCRVSDPDLMLDRILGRLCTQIVANSRATGWRFAPQFQGKVRCVANGLNLERLRQPLPAIQAAGPDGRLILVVARLSRWKAHEVALEAFEEIARQEPRAHLVCLGGEDAEDPGWARRIQMLGARSAAADRIHWIGTVQDPRPWYQAAALLLHPARSEPFGRVLVEAMACGLPVVATGNGGVPEIVRNHMDGFLVKQDCPAEFAGSVLKLLNDEGLRRRMGASAAQRAEEFGLDRHLRRMAAVFDAVCAAPPPAQSPAHDGERGGTGGPPALAVKNKRVPPPARPGLVVDGREFLPGRMTGIGRVLLGLIEALCEWDPLGDIVLGLRSLDALPEVLRTRKQIRWVRLNANPWVAERQLAQMAGAPRMLFLSPYPKLPVCGAFPMVHIVHDVHYLTHPLYKRRAKFPYDRFRLENALGRASLTWYDSRASHDETLNLVGHAGRNPRVRFPGLDPKFSPAATDADLAVVRKHGLDPGYILVTGNGLPHKNIGLLLRCVGALTRRLAIVGVGRKARARWLASSPRGETVWIERVDDDELPALMRQAFCLAQPSTAEGYGLPPLEAMASGTPAVVSRIPVLRETTGGNAVMADPSDPATWVQAFAALECPENYRKQVGDGLRWAAPLQGRSAWAGYREDLLRLMEVD
jgi:glycosyltransferase involved in cell wall biosynthesis